MTLGEYRSTTERLLSNLQIRSIATRDEQAAAGYAELMDLMFSS